LEILFATDLRGFSRINQGMESIREDPRKSVADFNYEARPANGNSAARTGTAARAQTRNVPQVIDDAEDLPF